MNIPMCVVCGEPAAFPTVVKEPYTCLTCQRAEPPATVENSEGKSGCASVNGWTAAIGKKLISAKADEYRITLKFEDGITAEITSDGGMGYNEGMSWLKWEVEPSNAPDQRPAKLP